MKDVTDIVSKINICLKKKALLFKYLFFIIEGIWDIMIVNYCYTVA